jgi:hypothetical protein
MQIRNRILVLTAVFLALASAISAQGVVLKPRGLVLFGSAAVTTSPASVDFMRVVKATPEWSTIRTQGVREGSGRYNLLLTTMNQRLRKVVARIAEAHGCDCVFRTRDLKESNGLRVVNLTKAVLGSLR